MSCFTAVLKIAVYCISVLRVNVVQIQTSCEPHFFTLPQSLGDIESVHCKHVRPTGKKIHYVNVSVLIKFSQKTSVFTLSIISSS